MDKSVIRIGQLIKSRRKELGMSQQFLAATLGVVRPTISMIENNRRKVSADEASKLSKILNIPIGQLVGLEGVPEIVLPKTADKTPFKSQEMPMRISIPQKNLTKFKEVLLYILDRVGSKPNIGETVIYKLLYFIDFNFYEQYEEQLIGATYIKNHYGPTPIEFKKIIDKMIQKNEVEKVKSRHFAFPQTKYLPRRKPDLSGIQANELEVIEDVLNKLSGMNATQISEYSHNDVPWLTAVEGRKIEYESVFYRTPGYSVREYGENIS
ncbi:MAG: DUF4065 domain-containing protein [Elusimicrobia bacterium]|nr:DUF4065 domain-containing protein [Elusimicrobiota bacterium]